ncbi:MAG TPA: hypothetical protein VF084_09385 [Nitrososphaeraceae archaeon]
MQNNTGNDQLCNFGFYTKEKGLAKDVYEKDCTKPGINVHENLAYCDEHYQLVVKS